MGGSLRLLKTFRVIAVGFAWALACISVLASTTAGADSTLLPVDPSIQPNVAFWREIYTRYYTHQGVLHDAKYVDHVYEVVELGEGLAGRRAPRKIRDARAKWREVLLSLHRKRKTPAASLSSDERKIAALFADIPEPDKYLLAARRNRIRFQLGQKDRFLAGLHESGLYLPMMEEVFRREGVPVELTRLPFVESSFNLNARSKAGASGIWQFMRRTGKNYFRIDSAVDERNDPIRATEAAARLLKSNYRSLGSWPLAITAYNHGVRGVQRSLSSASPGRHGRRHHALGFASANFYPELLAAVEAERDAEKYFGTFVRAKPKPTVEIELPDQIALPDLCRFLKIDPAEVRAHNPAFLAGVYRGRKLIPAGYRLRLPADAQLSPAAQVRVFQAGYEQIPGAFKQKPQKRASYGRHRVKGI
jgi:membrane-bound lytic murein transglycosylase D